MSFGDDVEVAAKPVPPVWRLMVWDVPDRFGGLLARLGFHATKKNPDNWWRIFDPATPADKSFAERCRAERCRAEILALGLKGSWQQVERRVFAPARPLRQSKKFERHAPRPTREGFGGKLNARPISGSWRRKTRHR